MRSMLIPLVLVAMPLAAQAFTNPSFETGDLTGWILMDPNGEDGDSVICTGGSAFFGGASEGSCALQLNGGIPVPDAILEQSLVTIPGGRYELSFDIGKYSQATVTGTASVLVELFDGAVLLDSFPQVAADSIDGGSPGVPMSPGDFVRFSTTFVALGDFTELRITDQSTNGGTGFDTMLDNFALQLVAEPAPVPAMHPIALYVLLPGLLVGAALLVRQRRGSRC